MWSPLTTAALSGLPSTLYPHGSAAFSAVQQLGGAAGTAILVSAYTIGANAGTSGTLDTAQAVDAARAAFTAAAVIACVSVVASLFVRRAPASDSPPQPAPVELGAHQ
jgi:DHA2 family lincomycin resistance protein-like MFS transporter